MQSSYGLEAFSIVSRSSPEKLVPLSSVIPLCEAEIQHSIENEHGQSVTDLLARRCRLAMVDLEEANRLTTIVKSCLNANEIEIPELNLEH